MKEILEATLHRTENAIECPLGEVFVVLYNVSNKVKL